MKKFGLLLAVAAVMSATVGSVAKASFAISNTGVAGVNDALDANWTVTAAPTGVPVGGLAVIKTTGGPISDGIWEAPSATSNWIKATPDFLTGALADKSGLYEFTTTFSLSGFDASTALIKGRALFDDDLVDIILNGTSLAISVPGAPPASFKIWAPFVIPAGSAFVNTVNTLTFKVNNRVRQGQRNPVGLRVEFTETFAVSDTTGAVVPEPAAVASWLIGSVCAVGMIGLRRRRSADSAVVAV